MKNGKSFYSCELESGMFRRPLPKFHKWTIWERVPADKGLRAGEVVKEGLPVLSVSMGRRIEGLLKARAIQPGAMPDVIKTVHTFN